MAETKRGTQGKRGQSNGNKKDSDYYRFFVEGISVFKPRVNAPDFIISDLCIDIDKLTSALNDTDPNEKTLYGQVCESKEGKYYLMFNRKK